MESSLFHEAISYEGGHEYFGLSPDYHEDRQKAIFESFESHQKVLGSCHEVIKQAFLDIDESSKKHQKILEYYNDDCPADPEILQSFENDQKVLDARTNSQDGISETIAPNGQVAQPTKDPVKLRQQRSAVSKLGCHPSEGHLYFLGTSADISVTDLPRNNDIASPLNLPTTPSVADDEESTPGGLAVLCQSNTNSRVAQRSSWLSPGQTSPCKVESEALSDTITVGTKTRPERLQKPRKRTPKPPKRQRTSIKPSIMKLRSAARDSNHSKKEQKLAENCADKHETYRSEFPCGIGKSLTVGDSYSAEIDEVKFVADEAAIERSSNEPLTSSNHIQDKDRRSGNGGSKSKDNPAPKEDLTPPSATELFSVTDDSLNAFELNEKDVLWGNASNDYDKFLSRGEELSGRGFVIWD